MTTITTKLIKDGNSTAVRLPKTVLAMSGLHGEVQLEVAKGRITLRQAKFKKPRQGWREQIEREIKKNGPMTYEDDYGDLLAESEATLGDGLK